MADPVHSATTLFANVLITTFSAATVALTAAGTVTAVSGFFDLQLKFFDLQLEFFDLQLEFFELLEFHFFRYMATVLSVCAQVITMMHFCDQGYEYDYCVWMASLTVIALLVGVATGIMLSVALGQLVEVGVAGAMARIDLLRQSEKKEDLVVARLGIILVHLAAILTLLGAVYVGTAWLGSGETAGRG